MIVHRGSFIKKKYEAGDTSKPLNLLSPPLPKSTPQGGMGAYPRWGEAAGMNVATMQEAGHAGSSMSRGRQRGGRLAGCVHSSMGRAWNVAWILQGDLNTWARGVMAGERVNGVMGTIGMIAVFCMM